jgi:hypothetical protein
MILTRIPQRVSNCLFPFSSHFKCPQGRHFRLWCWLLVTLAIGQGQARLKDLTRMMPRSVRYWAVRRFVQADYWDASALIDELAQAALLTLPPPADRTIYLIGDLTIKQKSGRRTPLVHKTRMNHFASYVFGLELVLLIAHWGRFRVPVGCDVLTPKRKGHRNILFRQMLRRFQPPGWCQRVVVLADAGFASKANLRLVARKNWFYVFSLPRSWKLVDGPHLKSLAQHLPKARYRRVASHTPERRRRDYWVYLRRAQLNVLGDVTVLLSKRRHNDGPTKIRLIVTNLDVKSASEMLNLYARRWMVEVTFKELKSGLQLGRMQVTKDPKRVRRAVLLPVMAYQLLVRIYGKELAPDQGVTIFQLKQRFSEEVWQEQLDRSEARWRKKLDQLRVAA